MIAIALLNLGDESFQLPLKGNSYNYDLVIPMLLQRFLPSGVLGLGLTALMASFMSGMAGNVTAFNTVFTYDIYQSYLMPNKPDNHYLRVGQLATIFGVGVSILTAYVAALFNNIMDFIQLIFAFINAPLFAAFLTGMFNKRTTGHGAFWGLVTGTISAAVTHGFTKPEGATSLVKGGWTGTTIHTFSTEMAQNFWIAIIAFTFAFFVIILISLITKRNKTDEELKGLVYSLTPRVREMNLEWYKRPGVLAIIVSIIAIILSAIYW
jgi:SSS family solute:Na+ symporter